MRHIKKCADVMGINVNICTCQVKKDVNKPKAFYDKWENGEVGYWFSHSGTTVIQ